jgi:peptidyl-prolyl cis-trans isomerase SurA
MKYIRCILLFMAIFAGADVMAQDDNVVDEVIWVVGDEPILKSDVEAMRVQAQQEGMHWDGNPDCAIPEELAVQKLFLHQAAIDSIQVTESEISQGLEQQINYWIETAGSREKLEEYKKESISQIRSELHDDFRDRQLVTKMKESLVKDVAVTPSEVRRYFSELPEDSIPYVPTEVEVEIVTRTPKIEQEEINRVKDRLREFTDRVNNGTSTFTSLATLYSEDPGSARHGGELDYMGRGMLDPAFATVAFNLTDPKKVSKIVESDFGFHIIQLVDKRGDKIKVRHILLKPHVSDTAVKAAIARLDSIGTDIRASKFTFEEAASVISDDKDTKNNHGLMANSSQSERTSKFRLQDLPAEIAVVVDTMKVGEVSRAFSMVNSKGKTVCAIAKLKSKVDGHKASMREDYQILKNVVIDKRKQDILHNWIVEKLKNTYVRVNDRYKNCDFKYKGWIK